MYTSLKTIWVDYYEKLFNIRFEGHHSIKQNSMEELSV